MVQATLRSEKTSPFAIRAFPEVMADWQLPQGEKLLAALSSLFQLCHPIQRVKASLIPCVIRYDTLKQLIVQSITTTPSHSVIN